MNNFKKRKYTLIVFSIIIAVGVVGASTYYKNNVTYINRVPLTEEQALEKVNKEISSGVLRDFSLECVSIIDVDSYFQGTKASGYKEYEIRQKNGTGCTKNMNSNPGLNYVRVSLLTGEVVVYPYSVNGTRVSKNILERAEGYIASKVGMEYAQKNYRLDEFKSYRSFSSDTLPDEYFLQYEYLPATRISDKKETIFIRVIDKPDYVINGFVACIKNGIICEPKITRDQAIKIVKDLNRGVNSKNINAVLYYPNPIIGKTINNTDWTWNVSINLKSDDPMSMCFKTEQYYVSAQTGEVKKNGVSEACS